MKKAIEQLEVTLKNLRENYQDLVGNGQVGIPIAATASEIGELSTEIKDVSKAINHLQAIGNLNNESTPVLSVPVTRLLVSALATSVLRLMFTQHHNKFKILQENSPALIGNLLHNELQDTAKGFFKSYGFDEVNDFAEKFYAPKEDEEQK